MEMVEPTVKVMTKCVGCGDEFFMALAPGVANEPMLLEANRRVARCAVCRRKEEAEDKKREEERQNRVKLAQLEQNYEQRRRDSQLDKVCLGWDGDHPGANLELFRWMESRWRSADGIMMKDETGKGKSRILQHFGYEFLRTEGSVYYARATQLAEEIAAEFGRSAVKGEQFVKSLYRFDLLIIDDFGQEALTDSRIPRLWDLIDMRYTQTERRRNIRSGRHNPLYDRPTGYGARLWISTNSGALEMARRFGDRGDSLVRRLVETCEIRKAGQ